MLAKLNALVFCILNRWKWIGDSSAAKSRRSKKKSRRLSESEIVEQASSGQRGSAASVYSRDIAAMSRTAAAHGSLSTPSFQPV